VGGRRAARRFCFDSSIQGAAVFKPRPGHRARCAPCWFLSLGGFVGPWGGLSVAFRDGGPARGEIESDRGQPALHAGGCRFAAVVIVAWGAKRVVPSRPCRRLCGRNLKPDITQLCQRYCRLLGPRFSPVGPRAIIASWWAAAPPAPRSRAPFRPPLRRLPFPYAFGACERGLTTPASPDAGRCRRVAAILSPWIRGPLRSASRRSVAISGGRDLAHCPHARDPSRRCLAPSSCARRGAGGRDAAVERPTLPAAAPGAQAVLGRGSLAIAWTPQ